MKRGNGRDGGAPPAPRLKELLLKEQRGKGERKELSEKENKLNTEKR